MKITVLISSSVPTKKSVSLALCGFIASLSLCYTSAARAQNPDDYNTAHPPVPGYPYCGYNSPTCGMTPSPSTAPSITVPGRKSAPIQSAIDTPDNRLFADRVYSIAFEGISSALRTKGLKAALELSQNPQNNRALMAAVIQPPDEQFTLAAFVVAGTMADAATWLNGARTSGLPTLRDSRWTSLTNATQKILNMKAASVSEFAFIQRSYSVPDRFDLKTRKAAGGIIAAHLAAEERAAEERRVAQEQAAKVEAARQEQARIAQAQAEAQARIAKEQAKADAIAEANAAAARVAALQARKNRDLSQANVHPSELANQTALATLLNGKSIVPAAEIGMSATGAGHVSVTNGRDNWYPATTMIYPNGREFYRVEHNIIRADAAQYRNYPKTFQFRFAKLEFKGDHIEMKIDVFTDDPLIKMMFPSGWNTPATVKIMLPKDWQKTMTNEQVLAAIEKPFAIAW